MCTLQQKREELARLEDLMNSVFAEIDVLEKEKATESTNQEDFLGPEDEKMADEEDALNHEEVTLYHDEEIVRFLGINPAGLANQELNLNEDVALRIKSWIIKGLTEKDEKENLLATVPRKGQLNLEAPLLNDEVTVDLQPRALARDEHFKDYQNLTGSAISAVATVLNSILNDDKEPLEREVILENLSSSVKLLGHLFYSLTVARKTFLLGKYEDRIQKILKKIEPTTYLFGDNLKAVIESSKAMEKVSKDLKPKPRIPLRQNNSLNWRSLSTKREVGRGGFRNYPPKAGASRNTSNFSRPRPYPAKRNYSQTQPQQNRR